MRSVNNSNPLRKIFLLLSPFELLVSREGEEEERNEEIHG